MRNTFSGKGNRVINTAVTFGDHIVQVFYQENKKKFISTVLSITKSAASLPFLHLNFFEADLKLAILLLQLPKC
jgi:hypothetical protein